MECYTCHKYTTVVRSTNRGMLYLSQVYHSGKKYKSWNAILVTSIPQW